MLKRTQKFSDNELIEAAKGGATCASAAQSFGVSKQAVHQRAMVLGITEQMRANGSNPEHHGGKLAARYGLSLKVIQHLQVIKATRAFNRQRSNARLRGIEWRMTLSEWWGIWDASGKWEQRGCQLGGWVMARYGDLGAYEPGNVYITNHSDNAKTAQSHARRSPAEPRIQRQSQGKGWVLTYRRKYVAFFKRIEDAEVRRQSLSAELLTSAN
jgi:hypothetical protein